jgi:signal transduction histidine kinase
MMRQVAQDRFTLVLALFVLVACATVAGAFYAMRGASGQMTDAVRHQQVSSQLMGELRQSSDDLTRFVRTYAETGDPRYKRAFEEVLAIRNGTAPRPAQYDRVYWDLVLIDHAAPTATGETGASWYTRPRLGGPPVALLQLMRAAGFAPDELSHLMAAEHHSSALAAIERTAMSLLDGSGHGGAGPTKARALLFGPAYHAAKRDIMLSIDQCGELVKQRTRQEVARADVRLHQAQQVFLLAVMVLLAVAALMVTHVRSRTVALLGTTPEHLQEVLQQMASGPLPEPQDVAPVGALAKLHITAERLRQLMRENAQLEQDILVRSAELKQVMEELIQNQTVAALGGLVAGVAHELNTPIGNAVLASSTLGEQLDTLRGVHGQGQLRKSQLADFLDASQTACAIVARNLQRAAELVDAFKLIAVDQASGRRHCFGLHKLVQSTLFALEPMYKKKPVTVRTNVPEGLELDSFPGALEQVLINLVSNAVLHGIGGRACIAIDIEARYGENAVWITVRDDGVGIPPEVQRRIFEPFFTTRMGSGGSGLGLYLVHQLVYVTLGGSLKLQSVYGAGSSFEICLPVQLERHGRAALELDGVRA